MLFTLPPEILLHLLGYLDLKELLKLRWVSHELNELIKANEASLYRTAAIKHRFIDPDFSLNDARVQYPGGWLDNVQSWKDLCKKWYQLERNWEGRGDTPEETLIEGTGPDVHRFKLDEEQKFVVTTHRRGGLRVTCTETNDELFVLPKSYVRQYAHCEYGNGFLIFDRLHPHSLEIWRHESMDWNGNPPPSLYTPDERQFKCGQARTLRETYEYPRRGTFAPWSLFTPTHNPRAYRFVYPTLLVGSQTGQELYLFDVPSAMLEQVIPLPRLPTGPVRILYVELGTRHVFVCTLYEVLIIARDAFTTGSQRSIIHFPRDDPGLRVPQLVRHYAARMVETFGPPSNPALKSFMVIAPRMPAESTALVRLDESPQEFYAVHVSPDGRDFATITWDGVVYLVRDFERVLGGQIAFSDITLRLDMGASVTNLAFDYGRAAIVTHSGIYIFNWDISFHGVISRRTASPEPFPNLTVHQLLHFSNPLPLRSISCVKLTKTAVWLDWSSRALDEALGKVPQLDMDEPLELGDFLNEQHPYANRMVCRVNFAPRTIRS